MLWFIRSLLVGALVLTVVQMIGPAILDFVLDGLTVAILAVVLFLVPDRNKST